MKIRSKFIFFNWIILMVMILSPYCTPIEVTLVWKKELKRIVEDFDLAEVSGDVIFVHGERKNKITLIDKEGDIRWQWGPDLKLGVLGVSISNDGRYFVYWTDSRHESDVPRKSFIHYRDRDKGELWKKELYGSPHISPDGKYIFVAPGWENWKSFFMDSKGNILWEKKYGSTTGFFSPDGNFIWDGFNYYDKNGKIALEIDLPAPSTSFAENFEYIACERMGSGIVVRDEKGRIIRGTGGIPGAIINKSGSIILEGRARVSDNGKVAVIYGLNKTKIYKLPEKSLINEYPIKRYRIIEYSDISYDGNIIVILGERTDIKSNNNLFIVDLSRNEFFEGKVEKLGRIYLTIDGKNFLVKSNNKLYFYEISN